MKKIIAIALAAVLSTMGFLSCSSPSVLTRGSWDGDIYYNQYGDFKLRSNELFDRYTDKKIKDNLGYVYSKNGQVLNDMVISSDYCAIVVTLEKTGQEYSAKEYVDAFIKNSRAANKTGSYSIAESYLQDIGGGTYTAVPILYYTGSASGLVGYCEYCFIKKAENNVFVVIRITSTSQLNVEIALKMFEDPNAAPEENPPSLPSFESPSDAQKK